MTRAEAIDFLKAGYPDSCYKELREAVDMAIKALSQPVIGSCENCKWSEEVGPSLWLCDCKLSQIVGSYTEPDFYCKYWVESGE